MRGWVRQRGRKFFVRNRAQQDKTNRRILGNSLYGVDELVQIAFERRQAFFARERSCHAITEENNRRFDRLQMLLQAIESFFGRIEACARFTQYSVRAPAEIAEENVPLGKGGRQPVLNVTVTLLSFDEC